ncbi:MAG: DUF4328 domain-containing protein [Alphaproteobacteria bacterium]|nr:DUF4328 domain-containing protein [Rhizobiaceae bacterium]MBU3961089.1 DUF4328 domain-containing protein [Alphaproteobacteria bacterium]MBU4051021.1 DUF4328 domain-containing protein [Alphaproteobacteria bacterium]MBU4087744.1 DUF4328 domain-containing protein [Alphaproteobacteria bacterium]MBU4155742.1 DUF4328 domain-containing protein [Alphaproteobacteria bacterium]
MTERRITPAKSLAAGLTWARRAWVLTACVSGAMLALSTAFYLYLAFVSYVVEKTGSAFRTGAESPAFQALLDLSGSFDLGLTAFQLLAILFFLRWIWLSVTVARAVRQGSVRYVPWMAVAGFLVPIVNLWMPLLTMVDIEEFAAAQETRPTGILPWYPAGMVLSAILVYGLWQIVSATPVDGFSDPSASQRLMQVAALGAIANMVLLMLTYAYMHAVTPGLELALRELAEAQGLASPAPLLDDAVPPRSGDDIPGPNA